MNESADERERRRIQVGEQLAAALLPTLLHRVNNTTQLIVAVRALAALQPLQLPERSSHDLAHAAHESHVNGWLLGVLARGLGADLLLARENYDGLLPTLELVREALLRERCELAFAVEELPRLCRCPDAPDSADLCASIAALLCTSAGSLGATKRVALAFVRGAMQHALNVDAGWCAELRTTFEDLDLQRRGCELRAESQGWSLRIPAAWLSFRP